MPVRSADTEARAISRYLVNRDCPQAMVERYAAGVALIGSAADGDDAVASFAFRRRWSLPFLDAASAFVAGGDVLRARVLLMAAILEASPDFTTEFLLREIGRGRLLVELVGIGLAAAVRIVVGVPLLLLVRRAP